MEVCVSGNTTHLSDPTNFKLKNPSVNGLKACLKEFISLEDTEISTTSLLISSEKSHKGSSIVWEDDIIKHDNSDSGKCFDNHAGLLSLGKSKPCGDGVSLQEEDKAFDSSCVEHCAKPVDQVHSQPAPAKQLVSAMKGNRERRGKKPDKKLTVSWAADVYDPIPTSVSHVPSNTANRKKRGKRNNTNNKKQKGGNAEKSSTSRKRKDKKKQAQKNNKENSGGKSTAGDENELESSYSGSGIVNLVTGPSACGSSFLKESMSGANMRLPVTVAK